MCRYVIKGIEHWINKGSYVTGIYVSLGSLSYSRRPMKGALEVAKKMCGYVININIWDAMNINTKKPCKTKTQEYLH